MDFEKLWQGSRLSNSSAEMYKDDIADIVRVALERHDGPSNELAERYAAAFVHACDDEGTCFGLRETYDEAVAFLKRTPATGIPQEKS